MKKNAQEQETVRSKDVLQCFGFYREEGARDGETLSESSADSASSVGQTQW